MNPIERERIERMENVALFRETVKSIVGGITIAIFGWLTIHLLFSL